MMSINSLPTAALLASFLSIQAVVANWDSATGYVHDNRPNDSWMARNKPTRVTKAIQVAECAINTRLAFPDVQLFALFEMDPQCNTYHGCPYGTCSAYTTFPQPEELVVEFTKFHSFFWHDTGGIPGTGTRPICDPQTGEDGYESSLDGKFHDGPADKSTMQLGHDSNYPNFHLQTLKKWPEAARATYASLVAPGYPQQPKCGGPDEPNYDPGSNPNVYGGYKPAPASAYQPPKPYNGDTSSGGSNTTYPTSPVAGSNATNPTNPSSGSNNTNHPTNPPNLPKIPVPGSNETNSGSNDTNPPKIPAPSSNDTNLPIAKPKHHGHQGHNSTKHHGHQGNHGTDQDSSTSSSNSPTDVTNCASFCQCTSSCIQSDECCLDKCKEQYTGCESQDCKTGKSSTLFEPLPIPSTPPTTRVVRRHSHRTARH